ncbi:cupin domain-containing protein [Caulobacter sp. S45]|uniref:cupin domain-containing protein n=1 Tax=Caulobacter sp. S45 TaxID=1641861 RepID=UPI00131D0461|nr:cupin domain-containing protein [Caulobacter sp. S45]
MTIRRIVTGHDAAGVAIVVQDGPAKNVRVRQAAGGLVSTLLWVTDGAPADISSNADTAEREIAVGPPPSGAIFRMVDFPPLKDTAALDQDAILREMGVEHDRSGGGARHPFTHRTRSVDFVIVLSGRIRMLLDESEVTLQAGDVMVQQGTNHAWINSFDEPCRIAFVLIDADAPPAWDHAKPH